MKDDKTKTFYLLYYALGGVGSWAASMLVRSGVGKIRLIDFDQVSLSSLNRHATAVQADVGTPKVTSMKKAFRSIAPWVEVDARVELFQEDAAEELLSGKKAWDPFFFFVVPTMFLCWTLTLILLTRT